MRCLHAQRSQSSQIVSAPFVVSVARAVPILGDTGLLRSLLFLWMEGRGEEELGHQRRAGLGGSAVAFGRVHGDRLRQSLML